MRRVALLFVLQTLAVTTRDDPLEESPHDFQDRDGPPEESNPTLVTLDNSTQATLEASAIGGFESCEGCTDVVALTDDWRNCELGETSSGAKFCSCCFPNRQQTTSSVNI